ncbi:MAG: tetratricopeptide repeat protein [Bacteroidota bacterium]
MFVQKSIVTWIALLLYAWPTLALQAKSTIEDSLQQALYTAGPEEKINLLQRIALQEMRQSLDQAEISAKRSLILATREQRPDLEASAYALLGRVSYQKGEYFSALGRFEQFLERVERAHDTSNIANAYNSLGLVNIEMGRFDEALKNIHQANQLWRLRNEPKGIASTLNSLGLAHMRMKKYDNAIAFYEEYLLECEHLGEKRLISYALNNLGEAYAGKKAFEKALKYYHQSLELKQEERLVNDKVITLINMGNAYKSLGDRQEAIKRYQQALSIAQDQGSTVGEQEVYKSFGLFFQEAGQFKEAEKFLMKSLRLADESGAEPANLELFQLLASLYAQNGEFVQAYRFQKELATLRDSLYDRAFYQRMADLETRYKLQKTRDENALLKAQQAADQKIMTALYAAMALAILTIMMLYFLIRNKKHSNKTLAQKNREIRRQNVQLGQQKEEIRQQNTRLQRINSDLEQFAYAASHDLKEPLRTIRSYLQLFSKRFETGVPDEGQEFLDFVYDGATRMDGMLSDLLKYSRTGRDDIPHKPVDLNEVLDAVKRNLHNQLKRSQAELTVESLPQIEGLEIEMVQLFQNLVSNGIKFQPKDQQAHITISSVEDEMRYTIAVADNGIGINPKYKEKVFLLFHRLGTRDTYQGTGIGLSICQKIVHNHGGEIWFESEEGKGTTFYLSLPKAAVSAT